MRTAILMLLLTATAAIAADSAAPSPEFARIKALVGTWEGKMPDGSPVSLVVSETAGGSAISERIFAGLPHEMLTVYYDRGGKLALTHYCMIGNRPEMALVSSDAKTIKLALVDGTVADPKESHMHALTIEQPDAKTLKQSWVLYNGGAEAGVHEFTFTKKP
jgi:hypothetical protein